MGCSLLGIEKIYNVPINKQFKFELLIMSQLQTQSKEIQSFENGIKFYNDRIQAVVQESGLSLDTFIVSCKQMVSNSPSLQKAMNNKVGQSAMMANIILCAGLGFIPNQLGYAWLIPYTETIDEQKYPSVRLEVGFQGTLELAVRSGKVAWGIGGFVDKTEQDSVTYIEGIETIFNFKPNLTGRKTQPIGFYITIGFQDHNQKPLFKYMTAEQVKDIRKKAPNSGNIKDPMFTMEQKTVLKQILKFIPKSIRDKQYLEVLEKSELGAKLSVTKDGEIITGEIPAQEPEVVTTELDELMGDVNPIEEVPKEFVLTDEMDVRLQELSEFEVVKKLKTKTNKNYTYKYMVANCKTLDAYNRLVGILEAKISQSKEDE